MFHLGEFHQPVLKVIVLHYLYLGGASPDVILRRTDADTKPPSVEHHRGQCVTLASTSDWSRSGPLLPQYWHGNLVHVQLILWHCNIPPFIHCNRHYMYSKKESIGFSFSKTWRALDPLKFFVFELRVPKWFQETRYVR